MAESMSQRVARITQDPRQIRNICTSAHIHHGKCIAPTTRLILTDGTIITAEELYKIAEQAGEKVRQTAEETVYDVSNGNFEVFSLNKETGKIEKKQLSHAWKLNGGTVITVELRNGAEITTTPEHRYMVMEDMDFVEKEANELKLGDRLVCARKIGIKENLDIKNEILERLSKYPCYARLDDEFGIRLKGLILKEGIKNIKSRINANMAEKSFYHGMWQYRYNIKDLLKIAELFRIPANEIYNNISAISFRFKTKSTKAMKLPHNFEDFFYLAGLFFGDGSGHKFVVGKEELKGKFISICKSLGINAKYVENRNRTPEILTNESLLHLLHALFRYPLRQKSRNIKIDNFIFKSKSTHVAQFIKAYFDCDGTVENSRRAISVTSVSSQMLKDLQLLLLRFNCLSIINDNTLYISGISARSFLEKINFGVSSKIRKTQELVSTTQGSIVTDVVPLSNKKLIKVRKVPLASIDHHYYKYEKGILTPTFDKLVELKQKMEQCQVQTSWFDKLISGDLAFIEITALEKRFEPIVYDFSVPENKNFVAEGIIIHNTAFTDNLMAAAGQMAAKYAGDLEEGMATWQHKDEQERLITVDAANVSMIHQYHGKEYLINLIDTPGHVDFGGNVTRAMRAIDGTVVLICAVEGIMPQTETVLRQALRERVKPVLFINKVDRLVKELKLTPEKIQERIMGLVLKFNALIEQIAEPEFKQKWKVSIQDGSVAFGSARENWALSFPFMQKKSITFKDILKIYDMDENQRKEWVWNNAPLHDVVLDVVIKHHPNPLEAQKYRIPKIWKGDFESEFGKDLLNCNPNGQLAFVITRIVIDPRSGKDICAGRLFSGIVQTGTEVYLNMAKQKQRIQNVYIYNGIKPEIIGQLPAGNVLAISGINGFAGETVTLQPEQPFEELKHIFEPVITKAIEAKKPSDLPKLIEVLRKVAKEDPSIKIEINEETGEHLMHGMGELHLEIIENRIITEKGVEVKTSPPIVVYRESITKKSQEAEGKSPNKHNKFYFTVEPLPEAIHEAIKSGRLSEGRIKKKNAEIREVLRECGMDGKEAEDVKDVYRGNIFLDKTRGQVYGPEVMEMVLDMFEDVMEKGPLAREPCIRVMVNLTDMKLHEDAIHRGPAQVYPAIREGIRGAMMTAGPVFYEPLQVLFIEAPVEFTGELSKLINSKRGQILDMDQQTHQVNIKAKMPVMEMLGWSSDLRSATEGRGVSSLYDQMFEPLPREIQDKVVRQIKDRKGLTDAMVGV